MKTPGITFFAKEKHPIYCTSHAGLRQHEHFRTYYRITDNKYRTAGGTVSSVTFVLGSVVLFVVCDVARLMGEFVSLHLLRYHGDSCPDKVKTNE